MILGTLQYMAPEQLEGKPADVRTDIFAFGALLYQMATGHEAFRGPSPAAVISAILKDHLPPMVDVQPLTPPAFDRVVQTCLAKDPDERWQTAHDVKVQLTWLEKEGDAGEGQPVPSSKRDALRRWAVPIGALAVTLACLPYIASRFGAGESQSLRLVRTVITPPDGVHFQFAGDFAGPPVLAPDGTNLAFVAVDAQGLRRLHVRRLDSLDAVALAGTEGATFPFWAPDSRSIGFFADGMLKRIEATGGAAVAVTSALNPRGASWGSAGTIVFEPDVRSALFAVAASGGQTVAVTEEGHLAAGAPEPEALYVPADRER
jgi:serine/threonine-protein kinase